MYNLTQTYTEKFFDDNLEDSKPIADYLAPFIVNKLNIKTVIDYGCATGHWVGSFLNYGVNVKGLEGSKSILNKIIIPKEYIYEVDLRFAINKANISMSEKIDLAFSFEVAEHIEEEYCEQFLDNLTLWDPKFILMTAAPPGQGGLGHVNEQPKKYWYDKLEKRGFVQDVETEFFLSMEIEKARRLENVASELQRPDMARVCPRHIETIGCEKGVWVPPWLPKNLMCVKNNNR